MTFLGGSVDPVEETTGTAYDGLCNPDDQFINGHVESGLRFLRVNARLEKRVTIGPQVRPGGV